ncbi:MULTISPECIES: ATP-binding protein [Sphingomonas]|uniref:ATP-binding protein n=1 Tax=Sphingomonas TaxID=13687 RepID=UPI000DF0096C|nr:MULTISPECIES: ATP-binding protein [Sphingomonas]
MIGRRLQFLDSILGRTLALSFALVVLLTAINLSIILWRSPPREAPLTSYEISRLLEGKAIAKEATEIVRGERPIAIAPETPTDRLIGSAIAMHLGVAPTAVRFHRTAELPQNLAHTDHEMLLQARLYPATAFNPLIFGGFEVMATLPDGGERVLVRLNHDPAGAWQRSTVTLLILALCLVLPIAWWFARALARPISAFASAADQIGREPKLAPVALAGPAEIRKAAHAVNEMQSRIQRYIAERTGVIGAIAHDLRTPLARLRFHLHDMAGPARERADGEIAEMEAMISATMDFVFEETRARSSELIDLALLVEGIVDDHADLGRQVVLESASKAVVRGDPLLLKRLFGNLIANAVTYGSEARVRVDVARETAKVTIADRGAGMTDADLTRAFEPFYRAEQSRNRQTGGIGLGLAIVRGAARAHGGDVSLANGAEGGIVATVSLPIA